MVFIRKLVPIEEIPKNPIDCPTENLMELYKVCQEMEQICEREFGLGLSAVQIGIPWNLFVINYGDEGRDALTKTRYGYYINCRYTPLNEQKEKSVEGCLSIKKVDGRLRYFEVDRYSKVLITGKELLTSPDLELIDLKVIPVNPIYRTCFQHELDHSHFPGVLISEIGREVDIRKIKNDR